MAIFGELTALPLSELLGGLRTQNGTLHVTRGEELIHIMLRAGVIAGVRREGQFLKGIEALETLRELVEQRRGVFWFEAEAGPPPSEATLHWPVEHLLLELAQEKDEIGHLHGELPDPETVFALTQKGEKAELVSFSLQTFWERARALLKRPLTVRQLARELGVSENSAALSLHKLRLAGYVEPARAFARERHSRSLRLLPLLRKAWQVLNTEL